jgi:hypothetical protein
LEFINTKIAVLESTIRGKYYRPRFKNNEVLVRCFWRDKDNKDYMWRLEESTAQLQTRDYIVQHM